jgi:hypothetical protein
MRYGRGTGSTETTPGLPERLGPDEAAAPAFGWSAVGREILEAYAQLRPPIRASDPCRPPRTPPDDTQTPGTVC